MVAARVSAYINTLGERINQFGEKLIFDPNIIFRSIFDLQGVFTEIQSALSHVSFHVVIRLCQDNSHTSPVLSRFNMIFKTLSKNLASVFNLAAFQISF